MQSFRDRLVGAIKSKNSRLCVGFDPDPKKLPPGFADTPAGILRFSREVLAVVAKFACIIKPNQAFWARIGAYNELREFIHVAHEEYGLLVILDVKRGDIGNTAQFYAEEAFNWYGADAVTLNGYMGPDTLDPWLKHGPAKALFVLAHTTNKGAAKFQERKLQDNGQPLFAEVAKVCVACQTDATASVGCVMAATFPLQFDDLGDVPSSTLLLVPGIGKQEGELLETVKRAKRFEFVISSSSGIIHASSDSMFVHSRAAAAAEKTRDQINAALAA